MTVRLQATLGKLARGMQELIWPHLCASCGVPLEQEPGVCLCAACLAEVVPVPVGACRICGRDMPTSTEGLCGWCLTRRPDFDAARSGFSFTDKGRNLVLRMKYGRERWLAHLSAQLMLDVLRRDGLDRDIDVVTPIPAHWIRRARLAGNPAAALAQELARLLGLPFDAKMLATSRGPGSHRQQGLPMRERLVNVKGTFSVRRRDRVKGLAILLVDDVMTTGATVDEAARVLKHAGARTVRVATAARTALMGDQT